MYLSIDFQRDIAVKLKRESYCGQYEHPGDADFIVGEVFMKDSELYANDDEGDELTFRLYPIVE